MADFGWRRRFAAGLLPTAAAAAPAAAQDHSDVHPQSPGWGMGRMLDSWGSGSGQDTMLHRVDRRLAFIRTELKITDAQMPAWNAFAEAVRSTTQAHNGPGMMFGR